MRKAHVCYALTCCFYLAIFLPPTAFGEGLICVVFHAPPTRRTNCSLPLGLPVQGGGREEEAVGPKSRFGYLLPRALRDYPLAFPSKEAVVRRKK